jgi:hypothetical protein
MFVVQVFLIIKLIFSLSVIFCFFKIKNKLFLSVHARVGAILPGGEGQGHQARGRRALRRDPGSCSGSKFQIQFS